MKHSLYEMAGPVPPAHRRYEILAIPDTTSHEEVRRRTQGYRHCGTTEGLEPRDFSEHYRFQELLHVPVSCVGSLDERTSPYLLAERVHGPGLGSRIKEALRTLRGLDTPGLLGNLDLLDEISGYEQVSGTLYLLRRPSLTDTHPEKLSIMTDAPQPLRRSDDVPPHYSRVIAVAEGDGELTFVDGKVSLDGRPLPVFHNFVTGYHADHGPAEFSRLGDFSDMHIRTLRPSNDSHHNGPWLIR
ncbi:hypothetical protein HYW21_07720 [Candidatus Woesearchaeota archaeon]|nr:hypothetical protein [Candidatus Woesearchaeota archaeon]